MEFRIADTFTDSLARLTGDEQKAVKTTAFDLQLNPASARPAASTSSTGRRTRTSGRCASARDIRLIVHRTRRQPPALLRRPSRQGLRLGGAAASWRRTRRTGAAQLVEIRETVKEIVVPHYVATSASRSRTPAPGRARQPLALRGRNDEELLGYGVPAEWLADVRTATEDTLLALADHLPAEAAEALLELATGGKPRVRRSRRPARTRSTIPTRSAASAS